MSATNSLPELRVAPMASAIPSAAAAGAWHTCVSTHSCVLLTSATQPFGSQNGASEAEAVVTSRVQPVDSQNSISELRGH